MGFDVRWSNRALRAVERLDVPTRRRIFQSLDELSTTGRGDVRRLRGKKEGLHRLRVGGWRVLFTYESGSILFVREVGGRGDVY